MELNYIRSPFQQFVSLLLLLQPNGALAIGNWQNDDGKLSGTKMHNRQRSQCSIKPERKDVSKCIANSE